MNELVEKALAAIETGTAGVLTEDEFLLVAESQEFVNALRDQELRVQSWKSAENPTDVEIPGRLRNVIRSLVSRSADNFVRSRRLAKKSLLRHYYLTCVRHPDKLTDADCYELDPKGDPKLIRRLRAEMWKAGE